MIGNFVAIDEIHKDHVKKEQVAHKNWKKNHGYMIDEIYKVSKLAKNAAFPIALMLIFNHQQWKSFQTDEELQNCGVSVREEEPDWKEKLPVKVGKSPPMPLTSSGQIGLRSTKKDCLLDIYDNDGNNFKKSDILKRFKWPREGQILS